MVLSLPEQRRMTHSTLKGEIFTLALEAEQSLIYDDAAHLESAIYNLISLGELATSHARALLESRDLAANKGVAA